MTKFFTASSPIFAAMVSMQTRQYYGGNAFLLSSNTINRRCCTAIMTSSSSSSTLVGEQNFFGVTSSMGVGGRRLSNCRLYSSSRQQEFGNNNNAGDGQQQHPVLTPGQKVQVEIVSFGPLGASVDIIGLTHDEDEELLPASAEPYGQGLVLQKEIAYFRQSRGDVDVVRGEVLPGYVQSVREDIDKVDVSFRAYGGKAKAVGVGQQIMEELQKKTNVHNNGYLPIGDKSSPQEINNYFPGVSKTAFKKAVGGLYRQGLIKPGPKSIELL